MLKQKQCVIVSLVGLGFLPLAQATEQPDDNRWYVAPFASYIDTGGDRRASDGWGAEQEADSRRCITAKSEQESAADRRARSTDARDQCKRLPKADQKSIDR